MGARFPCARDPQASRSLPLSAAINLHEIHLERQSLLQVPVGHIPVPGGIKLCSPGTFLVANYLIINNGSCQVNFTKPISATIRCTNSQWLRDAATEASVGKVAVPNPVVNPTLIPSTAPISFPSPRRDGTEVPVDRVVVPKTCQKTPLRHAGMPLRCLWAWSPCRRVGKIIGKRPVRDRLNDALPREDATGVLVGMVPVPKTGQKPPFATR